MSAEIVNLRRVRKAITRTGREAVAAENRARYGRTKSERAADTKETLRADRALDGAHRERAASDDAG